MLAPEERHGVEGLTLAEDIFRGCLALTLGHDPMSDTDFFVGVEIRPASDVPGGEDAGRAGLEVLVDGNSAIRYRGWRFPPERSPEGRPDCGDGRLCGGLEGWPPGRFCGGLEGWLPPGRFCGREGVGRET